MDTRTVVIKKIVIKFVEPTVEYGGMWDTSEYMKRSVPRRVVAHVSVKK